MAFAPASSASSADADSSDLAGLRKELPPPIIFLFTRIAGRRYRREIAPTWPAR
ncbi:hypothetical protein ACHIPV_06490 [Antrihabitans sp. NCIMB 15448]|uniref:Uncharacterized protein n=1 Tax=Antrihabitans spumae TaxID=3373370 RepID=A0ABW7KIF6_9NOCA